MTDIDMYTEYGVFVAHGSAEVLHKTFRKADMVDVWRRCNGDVEVTSVRARQVSKQMSMWSEPEREGADGEEIGTGGHDLVVSMGDCEFYGACTCGKPLGSIRPDKSLDELGLAWERHVMTEVPR